MAFKKSFEIRTPLLIDGEPGYSDETTITPELRVELSKVESFGNSVDAVFDCVNEATGEVVFQRRFAFVVETVASDLAAQAYAHVKSLPEYSDAVDC